MATPPAVTRDERRTTSEAPVGWLVGLGAAFGLLFALLLTADLPLCMAAGAVAGLFVGLIIDTWSRES